MIHYSKNIRRCARLVALASLLGATAGAWADAATNCDVHAAAMVAEMKASAATPMTDQEISLVRETARKSCLAQNGAAAPAAPMAPVAATQAPKAAAPATQSKSDNSFLGTLGAIFSGPTDRKPGNQRLLDRTQH